MTRLRRVCVFCGSSSGLGRTYQDAARALAGTLVEGGIGLVYGGGRIGLMGVLADAVLAQRGEVIGVIPEQLVALEVAHAGLTELRVVASMHERKATMFDLADAFVALPGGLGTIEELFEVATWSQLGLHTKPVGLLDVNGYFGDLMRFLDHAVEESFLHQQYRDLFLVDTDPADLLGRIRDHEPPPLPPDLRKMVRDLICVSESDEVVR